MRGGALALVAIMAALGLCQRAWAAPLPDGQAGASRASTSAASAMDSRRDIVLAVSNPLDPVGMHAGSDVLGYAPPRNYHLGERAASTLLALKRAYGWRQVAGWPIKTLDLYCIVLAPPAGMARDDLLKALARDSHVRLAEPLHEYSVYSGPAAQIITRESEQSAHALRYNDPYVDLQRGFMETDAALAQTVSQGDGVRVAIVDTGTDTRHEDLQGRIQDIHNFVDDDATAFNHDAHGTEVAGIIAADADNHRGIVGMAPKALLSVYKACWYPAGPDAGARCNSFTLAKALAAISDSNARIVNLSLGGPADPLLELLLAKLVDQGRIVVAALPPDGHEDGFPDRVPGVIVVSTTGSPVTSPGVLNAPGDDILTTQPDGGYDFTSGSSMAAAHVSGILALMLQIDPRLDARTARERLQRSNKLVDGVPQVDAASAVAALRSGYAARITPSRVSSRLGE